MNTTTSYAGATSTLAGIMGLESEVRVDKAGNLLDSDLDISPVTLSSAWSRMARLLLLASMAVGGSVGNIFMISAVVVEDQLKKRGIVTISLQWFVILRSIRHVFLLLLPFLSSRGQINFSMCHARREFLVPNCNFSQF